MLSTKAAKLGPDLEVTPESTSITVHYSGGGGGRGDGRVCHFGS